MITAAVGQLKEAAMVVVVQRSRGLVFVVVVVGCFFCFFFGRLCGLLFYCVVLKIEAIVDSSGRGAHGGCLLLARVRQWC